MRLPLSNYVANSYRVLFGTLCTVQEMEHFRNNLKQPPYWPSFHGARIDTYLEEKDKPLLQTHIEIELDSTK